MRTRGALLDPYEKMAGSVQRRAPGIQGQEVKYVVDYVSLADPDTMEEVDEVCKVLLKRRVAAWRDATTGEK